MYSCEAGEESKSQTSDLHENCSITTTCGERHDATSLSGQEAASFPPHSPSSRHTRFSSSKNAVVTAQITLLWEKHCEDICCRKLLCLGS